MKERTEKNRKQPFGYGVLEGVVCSIPAEAEMVQEIYRLYIKGMSIVQIAKVMTARGVPYAMKSTPAMCCCKKHSPRTS